MRKLVFLILIVAALLLAGGQDSPLLALEGGMGHYAPGAMASFIDVAPPPGFTIIEQYNHYDGDVTARRQLPLGHFLVGSVNVRTDAELFGLAYTSPWGILGGNFSAAVIIPYAWVDIRGSISALGKTISREQTASGLGDIAFLPFWLGWTKGDFKWDIRLPIFAPTGEYSTEKIANTGLNYWTFSPTASFSYLSKKIGLEISAYAGFDFNTENTATNYQSGDVFHLDATIAEHLPFFGMGVIGVGVNGYYWKQFTGDSGSGARLGSFEGLTTGIGPVLSYVSPPICGGGPIVAELKWLPELDVNNRTQGDSVWFKLVYSF